MYWRQSKGYSLQHVFYVGVSSKAVKNWLSCPWTRSNGRRGSRSVDLRAVVRHVCLDEVTSSQRAKERELSSEHRRRDDTSECLSVLAGLLRVGTPDPKHLEDTLLSCEDGSTADCADFDAGHRH